MTLEECIKEVIDGKFKSNDIFDSHAVINEIIRNSNLHEVYMQNFQGFSDVKTYHSHIAMLITNQGEDKVKDLKSEIVTHTIYGTLRKNHLWQKV